MRELRRLIQSATYERTLSSKQNGIPTAKTYFKRRFKDPYILRVLDLPELHSEKDLEKSNYPQFTKIHFRSG